MNIKKVRKQLKKINTLFSAIEDEGMVNSIERDLFKSYVLSLYEQVLDNTKTEDENKTPKVERKKEKKPSRKAESIFSESTQEEIIEKEPLEAIVEQEFQSVKNGTMTSGTTEAVIDLDSQSELVIEEDSTPDPANEEKYSYLFQSDDSNELSSRLSKMPIDDLNRAFGLNEKIFNINELFNGDNGAYQSTIDHLNTLTSLEDARQYLINGSNIINQYGWLEDSKINKAAQFIRVIHRKYM